MAQAQSGLFRMGTGSQLSLELDLAPHAEPLALMQALVAIQAPYAVTEGVNLVVGVAPSLWAHLVGDQTPPTVHDFNDPIEGVEGYRMPATQHALWLWLAGHAYDAVYDVAGHIIAHLTPYASVASETAGWPYHGNRDLTGFIDGTKNPSLLDAPLVALIPDGAPGAGGSIVLVQHWLHDAAAFATLSVAEQERVIGRSKGDSTELAEDVRGPASHVSRTTIDEGGQELRIFRRNTPFGTLAAHGTLFIGCSSDQARLERLIVRMAGGEDGIRDALTHYTTVTSGAYYFVPSLDALRAFMSGSPA